MGKLYILLPIILFFFSKSLFAQNVGIGESAPSTKLEIKGDGSDLLNIKDNSNDSKLFVNSDGDVGIGTTNPVSKLEIFNSNAFNTDESFSNQDHIVLNATDPGDGGFYGSITWRSGSRRRAAIVASRESADADYVGLAFYTQGTDGPGPFYESMRIAHSGNVGIGVSIPSAKLEVAGNLLLQNGTSINEFSTDGTLSGNSNNAIPTENAVKTYVDNNDDNTTYSAGNQLTLNGTTFNLSEGSGSGLDADLLDGQNSSYYLDNTDNQDLSNVLSNGNSAGGSSINMNGNAITAIGSGTRMNIGEGLEFTSEDLGGQGNDGRVIRLKDGNTPNAPDGHLMFVSGDDNGKILEMYDVGARFHTDLGMLSNKITGMADPTSAQDAATKAYVDAQIATTGDNLGDHNATQDLNLNNNELIANNASSTNIDHLYHDDASIGGAGGKWVFVSDGASRSTGNSRLEAGHAYMTQNGQKNYFAGNVGIGDDNPPHKLFVEGGSGYFSTNSNNDPFTIARVYKTTNQEELKIGIDDGTTYFHYVNDEVSNRIHFRLQNTDTESGGGASENDNNVMTLESTTAGGMVGINNTNPSYHLHVNGRIRSNGINETSDKRLKKDFETLTDALDKVNQINGVYYNWRSEEFPEMDFDKDRQLGVVAQEIQKVLPEIVDEDDKGYLSVEYGHLTPLLIEAVKELSKELEKNRIDNTLLVNKQQCEIDALKSKIKELSVSTEKLQTLEEEITYIKDYIMFSAEK